MVFHCFSLIFMVFLDFRCHGQGKWKKNAKKWKKLKISPSFWRFPGSEWESATLSPIFFSFAISCFFHFPLFLIVFHCFHWFSWFSWISGATGKENDKKNEKITIIINDKTMKMWKGTKPHAHGLQCKIVPCVQGNNRQRTVGSSARNRKIITLPCPPHSLETLTNGKAQKLRNSLSTSGTGISLFTGYQP